MTSPVRRSRMALQGMRRGMSEDARFGEDRVKALLPES